jgi:predicted RecB family nuclease
LIAILSRTRSSPATAAAIGGASEAGGHGCEPAQFQFLITLFLRRYREQPNLRAADNLLGDIGKRYAVRKGLFWQSQQRPEPSATHTQPCRDYRSAAPLRRIDSSADTRLALHSHVSRPQAPPHPSSQNCSGVCYALLLHSARVRSTVDLLITDKIFAAYFKCETKAHLFATNAPAPHHEISDWWCRAEDDYSAECITRMSSLYDARFCYQGTPSLSALQCNTYKFISSCTIGNGELQSQIDAVHWVKSPDDSNSGIYIPIRTLRHEGVTQLDKLFLAFDALALGTVFPSTPTFGRIMYGPSHRTLDLNLSKLIELVASSVSEISECLTHPASHQLNRHCAECCYQSLCHDIATTKDDLSLLSNMSKREQSKFARRGIFTVTQLSYTFRPRRRAPKQRSTRPPYSHSLKALAIRDRKIYVNGSPSVPAIQTPVVFVDVEGDADQKSYYLTGLLVCDRDSTTQHTFWANSHSEERQMWASCARVLSEAGPCHIVCYGEFERVFLRRMQTRYPDVEQTPGLIDTLLKHSTNVLSLIYAQIYFPTYSNSLKDVASYLGYRWTYPGASGQNARVWRCQWELSRDPIFKDRLIAYNIDDCKALELVFGSIERLCARGADGYETGGLVQGSDVVKVDGLKREYPQKYRRNHFANSELDYVNQCAYWDYQRSKVYLRTSVAVKKAVHRGSKRVELAQLPINAEVELDQKPSVCPKCGATSRLYRHLEMRRTIYDLRLTATGVRRRVVRYIFRRFYCKTCKGTFQLFDKAKFGSDLCAVCVLCDRVTCSAGRGSP